MALENLNGCLLCYDSITCRIIDDGFTSKYPPMGENGNEIKPSPAFDNSIRD